MIGIPLTNSVTIYPNPTNDKAVISLKDATEMINQIIVYDIAGKLIKDISYKKIQNGKFELETTNFSSGLYTVQVITNTKTYYSKLIKE